ARFLFHHLVLLTVFTKTVLKAGMHAGTEMTTAAQVSDQPGGHTVEKIGGTSMSQFEAVRKNIFMNPSLGTQYYKRIFVVSAYSGITNMLLEHKKTGQPGIFALFSSAEERQSWRDAFTQLRNRIEEINKDLFEQHGAEELAKANEFIGQRLNDSYKVLEDVSSLCQHGHFALTDYLQTVREMLASIGEIHSAWNTARLLELHGINAVFVDLSGWACPRHMTLDENIQRAFKDID